MNLFMKSAYQTLGGGYCLILVSYKFAIDDQHLMMTDSRVADIFCQDTNCVTLFLHTKTSERTLGAKLDRVLARSSMAS
jgi:hypothetical protein